MPNAAVVATALTSRLPRVRTLTVGGRDVPLDPAGRYGVPLDTVSVTEAPPGGVSSMSFTIEDYALAVSMTDGTEVRFFDLVAGAPIFLGFVQAYAVRPANVMRFIDVQAIGIEAILDWAVLPAALTYGVGTSLASALQGVVANAIGLGELRDAVSTGLSSQAAPIGFNTPTLSAATTLPAGSSVRQAIVLLIAAVPQPVIGL